VRLGALRCRRREPARRLGALLAIFALVLQLGLPLAHDPIGLGLAAPLLGAPLCHVGASGAGGHAPLPAAPGQGALCPICLGLAAASSAVLPPDPGSAALAALSTDAPPLLRPAAAPPSPVLHGAAQPRAPPALA
jgi:hypothetical protein